MDKVICLLRGTVSRLDMSSFPSNNDVVAILGYFMASTHSGCTVALIIVYVQGRAAP